MNVDSLTHVRLLDLDVLDARELERLLPEGSYVVEREQLNPGEHGDLATTAAILIVLGPPALLAITNWIIKKRHRETMALTFEKKEPDGTIVKTSVKLHSSTSEAPTTDVLQQIVTGLKLNPAIIGEVMRAQSEIAQG